jgi:PAS domain S-box-containing protein
MSGLSLFRATFHDSGVPQAIMNLDGYIIDANEAMCQWMGYDDLCGVEFQKLFPEDDPAEQDFAQLLKNEKTVLAHREFQRQDGSRAWANVYYSAVNDFTKLTFVLAQIIDISNEHAMELDLQKKQQELERFAYIASHDLREPLSTVSGYATLIKKRCQGQMSKSGEHWLEEIIAGTKRMAEKVDDLLAFSRAGRETPQGEFALGCAIEEGKRALARQFRETGGSIEIVGNLPVVGGDRSMVAQVFQNLFSNSLKYKGDLPPVITISAEEGDGGVWQVSVEDNGLGFDSGQFGDRIFEVFQRLYTVEKYPGTGIGLAIAKKIVERHGGKIWSESEPGRGAVFHFTLPSRA